MSMFFGITFSLVAAFTGIGTTVLGNTHVVGEGSAVLMLLGGVCVMTVLMMHQVDNNARSSDPRRNIIELRTE
jgi:hypothetical protein